MSHSGRRTTPFNELDFIKHLIRYKDVSPSISKVALTTIGRHIWYLSSSRSLFSTDVNSGENADLTVNQR